MNKKILLFLLVILSLFSCGKEEIKPGNAIDKIENGTWYFDSSKEGLNYFHSLHFGNEVFTVNFDFDTNGKIDKAISGKYWLEKADEYFFEIHFTNQEAKGLGDINWGTFHFDRKYLFVKVGGKEVIFKQY